ncbi:ferritin-like domain-containing protein [Sphingobium sp. EM0848]|uniref:ferritin-like domain-containing protein n=1 Tax=Sphingobium sp. EM0848 TaxID=2743473 RepID=UPI00159C415E|nr:ferritin-like domain-containing protein [Sphingobium sp. EM0848]
MTSLLQPLYWAIWVQPRTRARKLLEFGEVELQGGRDLVRAAELTRDSRLRRLFLAHARDEQRHASLFRARGLALLDGRPQAAGKSMMDWMAPGERGLDDLRVEEEEDGSLLAFIHLSESAAARDFALYSRVLGHDPPTQAVFDRILRDEESHMRYSLAELDRVAPGHRRILLWKARLSRLWKAYLRLATALAGIIATIILTAQYFILLPPFAFFAKRAAMMERTGWTPIPADSDHDGGGEFGP